MPTSYYKNISKIIELIIFINPKSILDVGPGFGKYGVLCREYLDLNKNYKFSRKIDCIEVFKKYITPLHKFVYNKIIIGNVLGEISQLKNYDLVLLIDVLEHFNKKNGKKLLKEIIKNNKGVLISIPKHIGKQGESFGNVHEAHLGQWKKEEFEKFGNCFFIRDPFSLIVYIGDKKIRKKLILSKIKSLVASIPFAIPIYHKIKDYFD